MALIAFDPRASRAGRPSSEPVVRLANTASRWATRVARRQKLVFAASGALVVALVAANFLASLDPPEERRVAQSAPAPAWIDVQKPLATFAFDAPEFAPAPATYAVRRHSAGGGREDVMGFGQFAGDGPYLRLVVHQVGGEGASDRTMFVDIARRAAEAGLALDGLGLTQPLLTRFGAAEWADARISSPADGAARENCAAFRLAADKPELRVTGFACGPNGEPYNRSQMSCLVGRLDLAAAGDDGELQKFFARSELARDAACPQPRPRQTSQPAPARRKQATRSASRG